jgi:hypothetical protein
MSPIDQWKVTFAPPDNGPIRAVAHRRVAQGIEVREGKGNSAEAAVGRALGRSRLRFATRAQDVTAEIAAFKGKSIRIAVHESLVTECEEGLLRMK